MKEKLTELIKYGSESATLDFKEIQYPIERHEKKNEILKDISAMANHPSDEIKFIIIGVKEENCAAASFHDIVDLVDEAKYQQFVNANIDPPINFEYKPIVYEGTRLAYFRIFNNKNRPYLFKKDLNNPVKPEKIEFRIGDGYIRQGTSTRKMIRDDFELIYNTKLTGKDRKPEIRVTPFICASQDEEVYGYNVSCFDVLIENLSSKSIDLDIEIDFLKSNSFSIIEKAEFKKEIEKKENELRKYQRSIMDSINVSASHFSLDVSVEDTGSHIIATRDKRRGERTAITIPQHDKERYAFCRELIILCKSPGQIQAEIIIRSDDFVDGAFRLPFTMDHQQVFL